RSMLERCLEKDPARRIRKAGELRQILESTASHQVSEGTWLKRMTRFLGGDRHATKPQRAEPDYQPTQIHLVQETFDEAIETSPAWSPDGSRLAFCREVG